MQGIGRSGVVIIILAAVLLYGLLQYSRSDPGNDDDLIITATYFAQRMREEGGISVIASNTPTLTRDAIEVYLQETLQALTNVAPVTLDAATSAPFINTPTPAATDTPAPFIPPTLDPAIAATGTAFVEFLTGTAMSRSTPVSQAATATATYTPLPTLTPTPTVTATETPLPSVTPTPTETPAPPTNMPDQAAVAPSVASETATPLPPSATPTPTSAALAGARYTVKSGDTLYRIALDYNTTVEELSAVNSIVDAAIFPGQELVIPGAPTAADAPTSAQAAINSTPQSASALAPTQAPPLPQQVNGIALEQFIILPPDVISNIREIYARGQELGRDPQSFTRIGDSTIEMPHFLMRFDGDFYNLGSYVYLEQVIDYYQGWFDHDSVAVRRGLHTWSVFDPQWARAGVCAPGEHMLACEIRQSNPSIFIVRLGSNDRGVPDSTERNLRRIVEFLTANGIIPIMGTKADRFDGAANFNNEIIRRLAAEYQLPLWDFDRLAATIPNRGLGPDNVHMTIFYAHDWTQPQAFRTGHGVHNLTALIMLDAVWRALNPDLL